MRGLKDKVGSMGQFFAMLGLPPGGAIAGEGCFVGGQR
jgi:hypothetical protein